jgi:hypothetical protein
MAEMYTDQMWAFLVFKFASVTSSNTHFLIEINGYDENNSSKAD